MDTIIATGGLGAPQRVKPSLAPISPSSSVATARVQIPVYVINLAKDTDRWCRIETALLALGILPIRIRGIDGNNRRSLIRRLITYDFATNDWTLTPGEIGCALSHIRVWKRVARDNLPAVVLEDDAEIPATFEQFYSEDLPLFLQRCDIVKFEGLFYTKTSRSGPLLCESQSTKLIVSLRPTLGAAGYALTPRGAEALLSRATKIKISLPVDHLLVRYDEHRATYGETRPLIVRQASEAFPSNIEAERALEDQRMRRILSSQSAITRLLRRTLKLVMRGVLRSFAMMRIILIARLFVLRNLAAMRRSPKRPSLPNARSRA